MKDSIKVFAPASVTNVACGFDILGFALDYPGDEIVLTRSDEPGIRITDITGDDGKLSRNYEENTAGLSLYSMVKALDIKEGFDIEIHKKMKMGTGMGSSSASAAGAVSALNRLLGSPLTNNELLRFALEGEKLTSGGKPHADNVAACLIGGFTLVRSMDPLDVVRLPFPSDLFAAVVYPHVEVKTAEARKMLKPDVQLTEAVKQWGNVAGLVAGLCTGNYQLISRSLTDHIVEPVRAPLIPYFYEVKDAALEAGALGSSISGSGPSIFALCRGEESARECGSAMKEVYDKNSIESDLFISKINHHGPVEIKTNEVI